MPRHKSRPTKRSVDSSQPSVNRTKRRKRQPRQRTEPLDLSRVELADGWDEKNTLRVEFPVDSSLTPSLVQLCSNCTNITAQVNLTLVENGHVKVQVDTSKQEVSLNKLFPRTNATWNAHIVTLVERGLLRLHINGKKNEETQWTFSFLVAVAWRKYMENCSAMPMAAAPRANPMRAMHHVMIWVLKHTHDAQDQVTEAEVMCSFRYRKEIEVLYDRFVGNNDAVCALFADQVFAMPEIYARIDATKQLSIDVSEYEVIEATSTDLLPKLRPYQQAAVSWMLSRETPTTQEFSLAVCVTFNEAIARNLQAYDPFTATFYTATPSTEAHQDQLRPFGMNFASMRGGILADEMGLGKTVEVIALVLSHRNSSLRPQLLSIHSPQPSDENEDGVMACICGSSETHTMGSVQCEFCGTWHHQLCTGFGIEERELRLNSASSSQGLWNFGTSGQTINETAAALSSGRFMCYHCQSHERPIFSSRTTLIVSPEPIHAQWENEISRHVNAGAVSVMRYPGVRALRARLDGRGPSAEWQVLASPGLVLAQYDIVLTTYEALGADLRHVPTTEGGNRRSSTRSQLKRYAFVGSPLVALHFWRVCMDEAQVGVENTRLQAALTLSKISAENRWVVTGTPFSSRVSELFGYLRFLHIPPYTLPQVSDAKAGENLQFLQVEHNECEGLDAGYFREAVEHNFTRGAVERVVDILLWSGQDEAAIVCGGGILWRTGKKHVLDQLGLPPQKNEVVWCRFAAVERHFYDQQEKRIVSLIQQRKRQQQRLPQENEVIDRDDRLWQDLLVLRQLCCHPQVGGARQAWGSSGNTTSGTVMTMDAFLHELKNKATRECEEAQRQLIGAQNGLAGLLVVDDEMSGAALKYMALMSLIRTNWSQFRADLLPRLHILQNLEKCVRQLYLLPEENGGDAENETFSSCDNDPKKVCLLPQLPALQRRISSTGLLSDSDNLLDEDRATISRECALLGKSARHIRRCYLLQADMMHTQAMNNFNKAFQSVDEELDHSSGMMNQLLCSTGNWWSDALAIIERSDQSVDSQLVSRVQARLSGFDTRWGKAFCEQLGGSRSLRLLLVREMEALAKRRRELFGRLAALSDGTPTDADVELSGNCKKCRDGGTGPICTHCQLYKELDAYRRHFLGIDKTSTSRARIEDLFDDSNMAVKDAGVTEKNSGGGVAVSLFVEIFKEILNCTRNVLRSKEDGRRLTVEFQTAMQTEAEFWMKLQREWIAANKLFQTQHQRLGALDELVMACSQMRLRQPGESAARTKAERLYKLERVEVPVREAELEADRAAADLDLRDKMAQLRYLMQLQSEASTHHTQLQQEHSSAQLSRPLCAVCLQEFTLRRAVLRCAHAFCTACISNLTGAQHTRKHVRCPTCRRSSPVDSVTIVVEEPMTDSTTANPDFLTQDGTIAAIPDQPRRSGGSLGSKLDALLARVDALRQENPGVKCLLFSQWSQMLELVVQALPRLGVRCFVYGTKRQLPKLLAQFQTCPAACVLALPFKVGANGLNIVEATEVLLIEPLLSASIEAQAVNRVHRLGQTRETRVHRFIVQGSVEERIFRLGHRLRTTNAEVEQVDNDELDNEGLQRLGVAPGRKEQEKLTMHDLQELLRGNSNDDTREQTSTGVATVFWDELVLLHGECVNRTAAYEFLKRRYATEARQDQQLDGHGPQTSLFGKSVGLLVAEELLGLAYPDHSNSNEVVEQIPTRLLQQHQDQIQEQICMWRNSQVENVASG
ncbi:hypothetical protein PHMEG_0001924 [Phytophthora megakarya]|uniref:RING-type domain-containing protein n=1 Tax=Phytophthora megakarya TaxID=4795 RepID=A0A225WZW7_9STRA|nr:hypothetical protein PHMEG_0001924 [Phytophthora megakarya]